MKHLNINWTDLAAKIQLSSYLPENGVAEHHAIIRLEDKFLDVETQYKNIELAVERLEKSEWINNASLVLKRYFVSDAVNQADFLQKNRGEKAISIVQQPPLNGTKVAVWVYFVAESKVYLDEKGATILERPHLKHLYNMQLQKALKNEYTETEYIFETYTNSLKQHNCTLKDNCIRTWIYVQGVDIHYADMVEARTAYFDKEDLTKNTHYIASTGIEGRHLDPQSLVLMDAYAVDGILQEQIKYLYAPTHLNPTYEYGVTFERGTAVDYGDRRHIFISGTASIDNKGDIVHVGNIQKQAERTIENIEVLLAEVDAKLNEIAYMTVYLRDTADYEVVDKYLNERCPDVPKVLVWAPVCRPGWLIEIECIAIKEIQTAQFENF